MVYKMYKIENFFYKIHLTPLAIFFRIFLRVVFSCDIPYSCKIGKNCKFPHHALGIVIHPKATIGDNCTILQGVTIGGRSGHVQLPIIGNNVLLGAGSIIMGPIKIGDNAIIGAGSVLFHDVEANEIWAGNPAKKIR